MSTETVLAWMQTTMLAATSAAPATGASGGLPLNAFDGLVIATLIVGLVVGRKRGMSVELLDVFQWLLIVVISSLYYEPLGNLFAKQTGLPWLYSYMLCYGFLVMAIKAIFTTFKVKAGEKVIGSDLFGGMEYYFGMVAGMIRFFCILLVVLALLNAIPFSETEIAAAKKRQEKELGSSFFPSFAEIQHGIFVGSMSGPFIRKHLVDLLIAPTNPNLKAGQPGASPPPKGGQKQHKADAKPATNAPAASDAAKKK